MLNANIKYSEETSNILKTAKKIIAEEIEKYGYKIEDIYLFGSRARGDFSEDSDWDFFAVTDKEIDGQLKWDISVKIRRRLAMTNKTSNDIFIASMDKWKEKNNDIGYLDYYVLNEGDSL
jgi:predicted nucleotidyltransferase